MDDLTRCANAARGGDGRAMEAFIAASYDDVYRLCAVLTEEAGAEDLAQESYVRILRALPGFRGEAAVRTWIMTITRRVCMDELRSRTRGRELANVTVTHQRTAPDPAGTVGAYDLIARLQPDRRAAFVLTQLWRFSYEEAAVICECPLGTIRSRVSRARGDLVDLLAGSRW